MKFPRTHRAARSLSALFALTLTISQTLAATACARQQQPVTQTRPAAAQSQPSPQPSTQAQPAPPKPPQSRTPSDTVREFHQNLRARRFREAFMLSVFKPAVEALSAEELEELRPEFEKIASELPEQIEIGGEQISGDGATVFVRTFHDQAQPEEYPLIRVGGVWLYGNREGQQAVSRDGKDFFIKTRIQRHHDEVKSLLPRIAEAEALYASTHGGRYADLPTLLRDSQPGFREEMRLAETLGYNFRITLDGGARSYRINAEPVKYGRTGKLSYSWQDGVMQEKDTGGKPYDPPAPKKKK